MTNGYTYEVALSFAGQQRDYVQAVNEALKSQGVKTFYDYDHTLALWGKNHTEELPRIYAQDAHLVLMFISEHYVDARWPRHERRAILTEMTQREGAYPPLGVYTGAVTHAGRGRIGTALEVDFHHGVTLTLCVPITGGSRAEITTSVNLNGLDPESTRRSARLALALGRADTAEMDLGANLVGKIGDLTADQDPAYLRALQILAEGADDLAYIQNETGVFFPMPDQIDSYERLWMRSIRLMLEGHAAPVPRKAFLGRALPGLDPSSFLEEAAFAVQMDGGRVTLAGHPVPLPDFLIYHPHVRIEGIREAVEDSNAGVENPREFRASPVDPTPFVAYIPQRLRGDATRSTPWGLTGVEEPPPTTFVRSPELLTW